MVVCRPPVCVYRLTCLDRIRTLGAVKPRHEDTALNIQGSNFPITRPGGVFEAFCFTDNEKANLWEESLSVGFALLL